jgi:hypothetical protein
VSRCEAIGLPVTHALDRMALTEERFTHSLQVKATG